MTGMWLTADEQRAWRTYLRLNSLLLARLNRQLQQDSGLTLPEYEVLVQLSEAPQQRRRPFQICETLNWEQSRLSHQLTRMQHRGLVAREECEADGRGAFVVLTAAGADAIRSAAPGHVAAVRRLVFDRLGDDQRAAFEQACTAIIDALAELGVRAAAGGIALAVAGLAAAGLAAADWCHCPSRSGCSRGRRPAARGYRCPGFPARCARAPGPGPPPESRQGTRSSTYRAQYWYTWSQLSVPASLVSCCHRVSRVAQADSPCGRTRLV